MKLEDSDYNERMAAWDWQNAKALMASLSIVLVAMLALWMAFGG